MPVLPSAAAGARGDAYGSLLTRPRRDASAAAPSMRRPARSRPARFVVACLIAVLVAAVAFAVRPVIRPVDRAGDGAAVAGTAAPAASPTAVNTPTAESAAPAPGVATAPAPTATVAALPSPTLSSATVVQQIAAAEAALQTGTLAVESDYGNGASAAVSIRFDRGDAGHERRLALSSIYSGATGRQVQEIVAVGDQTWHRLPDGRWEAGGRQDGLWEQLPAYLPQIAAAPNVSVAPSGDLLVLRWTDAARGSDVVLEVDARTGLPLRMRQEPRGAGYRLTVTYTGWNTPVTIATPTQP